MNDGLYGKTPEPKNSFLRQYATFLIFCLTLMSSACVRPTASGLYHDVDSVTVAKGCGADQKDVFINDRFHGAFSSKAVSVHPGNIENNTQLLECLKKRTESSGMIFIIIKDID
jgi:hypothetical protein